MLGGRRIGSLKGLILEAEATPTKQLISNLKTSWELVTSPNLSEAICKISFSDSSFMALPSTELTYPHPIGVLESIIFFELPVWWDMFPFSVG